MLCLAGSESGRPAETRTVALVLPACASVAPARRALTAVVRFCQALATLTTKPCLVLLTHLGLRSELLQFEAKGTSAASVMTFGKHRGVRLEDVPQADVVVVCCGGGGLLAGVADGRERRGVQLEAGPVRGVRYATIARDPGRRPRLR